MIKTNNNNECHKNFAEFYWKFDLEISIIQSSNPYTYHKNGSFHLCTNGHKNKDISGAGMKDKIPSPNSSSNDTRRCPESKSFFHIWLRRADFFRACLSSLSLLPLPSTISLGVCPEDEDGPMLGSPGTGTTDIPSMWDGEELVKTGIIGPSVAVFLWGGCSSKCSMLSLRLSWWFK